MASEKAEPPPLPSGGKPNDPIAKFQDRAKPILSESGGFANVECLVKLKALSQNLGLSEEQFNEAIASLQGTAPSGAEAAERERREKRFLKRLRKTLKLQHGNILSFRQRQNLVDAGIEGKHALPRHAVDRLIDQVAREENVRFSTLEEAQQYVAGLIRQVMGESPALDSNMRRRIWREGKKSGLSRGQVEEIIRKRATVNRLHDWSNWIAPGAGGLAVLVIVLLFVYFGLSNGPDGPEEAGTTEQPTTPTPTPKEQEPEKKDDKWWDVPLAIAMGTARANLPDFWPILERVRFNDPALRAEAYQELIKQVFTKDPTAKVLHDDGQARLLREVIVGCHALDPSDEAAARLRDSLLGVVPAKTDGPPENVTDYGPIYWAMETAVAALGRKGLDPTRADALALAIGERLQANFDRRLAPTKRLRQSMTALTTHLYRVLIDSVKSAPVFAVERHEALLKHGRAYLGVEALQSLDTDFLVALLSVNEEGWKRYQNDIEHRILTGAEPDVLKLFRLFQRSSNQDFQTFLGERFCIRFGVLPKSMTVEDVTKAVQDKIGLATGDRRQLLESRAARLLGALSPTAGKPRALLDETVRLAHLATLGCALAQGDLGHAEFDQGLAAYEKRTAAEDDGAAPSEDRPSGAPPQSVDGTIRNLILPTGNATARVRSLAELARIASGIADLTPEQGTILATYLLKPKRKDEHAATICHLAKVGQWKSVRLGLADALAAGKMKGASAIQRERVLSTVGGVLGKSLTPVAKGPWPQQQRILSLLLLRDVYAKLGTDEPSETQAEAFNTTQRELTEFYRVQARLLGLPPDVYSTMASPAEAIEAMIKHRAAKLAAASLRPPDKKYLDALPHELAAVQYLGGNDLAKTVLLQRIWARLLAAGAAKKSLNRAQQARKTLEKLQAADGKATHVLTQLRDGEAAILQMWMLLDEAKQ